jgi:hypothetical protein
MDKKGIVFTRPRDTISFFVGIVLTIFGVLPLLVKWKVVPFSLPSFMTSLPVQVLVWIVAVGGLYVVIDGFIEPKSHNLHWFLVAAGAILLAIGLIPILKSFGVIGFDLGIKDPTIYQIIITIEGIFLIIGGLTEH